MLLNIGINFNVISDADSEMTLKNSWGHHQGKVFIKSKENLYFLFFYLT